MLPFSKNRKRKMEYASNVNVAGQSWQYHAELGGTRTLNSHVRTTTPYHLGKKPFSIPRNLFRNVAATEEIKENITAIKYYSLN